MDASEDAQPIFGLVYKDELELSDEVLVTVIATGFDSPADTNLLGNRGGGYNPQGGGGQQPNPMLQGVVFGIQRQEVPDVRNMDRNDQPGTDNQRKEGPKVRAVQQFNVIRIVRKNDTIWKTGRT